VLNQGIIIKNHYPLRRKVVILDPFKGKYEYIYGHTSRAKMLQAGTYVYYSYKDIYTRQALDDVDIVCMAPCVTHDDLYFLHHVLELCYYFLPLHEPQENIFQLIKNMYDSFHIYQQAEYRRIFLCQFFAKLSIYPDNRDAYSPGIIRLISLINNSMVGSHTYTRYMLDNVQHPHVKHWLIGCMNTHSHSRYFKTIGFMKKL
jgi:hypothetical protein